MAAEFLMLHSLNSRKGERGKQWEVGERVSSESPLKDPLWKFHPLTSIFISLANLGNKGAWEMQSLLVAIGRKSRLL